jgi:hypothetical protein
MSRSQGFQPLYAQASTDTTTSARFGCCPDPDCGAPAEVYAETMLGSTDGPIPHARTYCLNQHFFLLPVDRIKF